MGAVDTLQYVTRLIRRNFVSVTFPTVTVVSIYADLRRTARWKRQLAEESKQKQ